MSIQTQKKNMQTIHRLVSQDLSYIYGEREDGFNGAKKQFHTKSAAFLRTLGNDLGFEEYKVMNNHGGIAISGEITLMGMWSEGNGLYFQLNQPTRPFNSFLFRSIKHMGDYSGGTNQWLPCSLFATGDYERLIDIVSALNTSKGAEQYAA
jgi:hypothetical protein